jgi:hypothetical protein
MPPPAENQLPNCMRCRHHVITHEEPFRYACQAMGFKSRQLPCREVLASSGLPCQFYEPREKKPAGKA